ncbi:MAG: glycosyltransferase family 4 protein [Thermoplasmata archaeon]
MRILRVHSWEGTRGGAEEYVWTISELLRQRGHPTHLLLLTSPGAELPPAPDESHVPVAALTTGRSVHDLLGDSDLRRHLEHITEEFRPDVIHLHHITPAFSTIGRWLSTQSVPVVLTAHDAELVCPNESLMRPGNIVCEGGILPRCQFTGCAVGFGVPYKMLQRSTFDHYVAPSIRGYLCPSGALTSYLHAHGYRPTVHLPSFAPIPDSVLRAPTPPPASEVPPTIGFLGRLEWYKGLDPLLRSIDLLARTLPNVRLDIAGTGPAESGARELARTLGIADRVSFRGQVRGVDKEEWFRGIHVATFPSIWFENLAFVAMEAQARGRPVVGTEIGGNAEVVHDGEGGRIVPVGDPSALAQAFSEILRSPDLARAMGERGRRWVLSEFTAERHLGRLLATYDAVLRGQRLASPVDAETLMSSRPREILGPPRVDAR